jgi:tRNA-dihydrouridine synthase
VFEELLPIFARHAPDLVTVHARTVAEMYRSAVHYEYISRAVQALPCPVLANGNIHSARQAHAVLAQTGARGLMIGRGAIRNPWLFQQIRQFGRGAPVFTPTGQDVLAYVRALYAALKPADFREPAHVQRLKKFMNYVGLGVEPTGAFLHRIRRVRTEAEFLGLCAEFLDHGQPMPLEPFAVELKETDVLAGQHC